MYDEVGLSFTRREGRHALFFCFSFILFFLSIPTLTAPDTHTSLLSVAKQDKTMVYLCSRIRLLSVSTLETVEDTLLMVLHSETEPESAGLGSQLLNDTAVSVRCL